MSRIQRHQLAEFIGNDPEAIRAFEDLFRDVNRLTGEAVAVSDDYEITGQENSRSIHVSPDSTTLYITLPRVSTTFPGDTWTIAKVGSGAGTVTVRPEGSETIVGLTSIDIPLQYNVRTFQWTGSYWIIVNERV